MNAFMKITGMRNTLWLCLALSACVQPLQLVEDTPDPVRVPAIAASNPADSGQYRVRFLYYGSGTDKRRAEYRDSVMLKTSTADASKFVPQYEREKKWAKKRENYWGFGPSKFPLNARVWYPEGDGPFPLVLIVHGNHDMKKFSDPGYAYLGELLASRGYIVASVDENFLNGEISNENDARGWLLLKHLEAFRDWNAKPGNPFTGKVDLANIGLIGHSRGGEAIAHAASFNRLKLLPDNANVPLDFNFAIKALIAIAPSDGQYLPADRLEPLSNVNYLVIHGAHDGDVSSFMGQRQYQRLRFTDDQPWFKSALYIYRANHGQFNTTWGDNDMGGIDGFILDKRAFLSGEDQRRIAKVYMSAFLDATLKGRREYLPMFADSRVASAWLPKTIYENRFEMNRFRVIADFEEDIDVTTGTAPGVRLAAESLQTWKENVLLFRSVNPVRHNNNVVTLGWNNRVEGSDSATARPARYSIVLSDSLVKSWKVNASSALVFGLASTGETPAPRKPVTAATPAKKTKATKRKDAPASKPQPLDVTVEMENADGLIARLPLSHFAPIRPPLKTNITKWKRVEKKAVSKPFDIVLQTYTLPFVAFTTAQPAFDLSGLRVIRFVFDRAPAGEVVLDQVGIQP